MSSTVEGRRIARTLPSGRERPDVCQFRNQCLALGVCRDSADLSTVRLSRMAEPTREDIDALVGPATPHFAYQLRARVGELIADLPGDHAVRRYGEEKMELLDRLGYASSLARDSAPEPRSRIGWETIPSSAPASDPLPRNE
jgi:hypothetical protein